MPAVLSPNCSLTHSGKTTEPKNVFKTICKTFCGVVVDSIKKIISLSEIKQNASIMERKQKTGKWISLIIDLLKVLAGFIAGVNV